MKILKRIVMTYLAFTAMSLNSFGQKTQHTSFPKMPVDENTKLVTYQKVVPMTAKPDQLYERALKWANSYYYNPLQTVSQDKANNKIKCVSNIKITTLAKDGVTPVLSGYVYYTLTIEARDNRYRYTISNFYQKETSQFPIESWLDPNSKNWTVVRYDHLHQIHEAALKLMESLEKGMLPVKVIVDEW
jgi:hypothetical protein